MEVSVSVEVPVAVKLVGLNAPLIPAGRPLVPNVTADVNPLAKVAEIVELALAPADNESEFGAADRENCGALLETETLSKLAVVTLPSFAELIAKPA